MNYKSTSILFLISIAVAGLFYYFYAISLWWFILPSLVFLALIVYGSANISSNFYTTVYCNANTSKKEIAITFDDGPNEVYTPKVLSVLSAFTAPATFFVIGKKCIGNEQMLKQIHAYGHSIGNHTFTHSFFIDFKSRQGFREELAQTSEIIFKASGKRIRLFRPPYGVTTPNLAKAAQDLNYDIIGWNIRSLDTTGDSEERIAKRIMKQIKPGSVILFHDSSEKTVRVLSQILNFVRENDYQVVSLEQLLGINSSQ